MSAVTVDDWETQFFYHVEEILREDEVRGDHWCYLVSFRPISVPERAIHVYVGRDIGGLYIEPFVNSRDVFVYHEEILDHDLISLIALRKVKQHRDSRASNIIPTQGTL